MKRVEWIDTYRGILIILVVLNHQSLQHVVINDSFVAIRMPAFFFISGFLLSQRYTDLKIFANRRFRQLIIPYFIFFTANWIFWVIALAPENINIFEPLKSMFFGCVNTENGQQNINAGPLWFITTLFMAEIYMFFVKNTFKTTKKILIVTIFLAFLGYLSSHFLTIRMPWNMEVALSALLFYSLGYIVKKENLLKYITFNNKLYLISIFFVTIFLAVIFSLNSMPNYAINNLGTNIIFTYLGAFLGIIALLALAQLIKKNIVLEFLGRNTFIILAFHLSALYFMQGIIKRLGFAFDTTINSDIWGVIYLTISMILILPIIYLINRFMPFILNRR